MKGRGALPSEETALNRTQIGGVVLLEEQLKPQQHQRTGPDSLFDEFDLPTTAHFRTPMWSPEWPEYPNF
jgi:hypothetical protein